MSGLALYSVLIPRRETHQGCRACFGVQNVIHDIEFCLCKCIWLQIILLTEYPIPSLNESLTGSGKYVCVNKIKHLSTSFVTVTIDFLLYIM